MKPTELGWPRQTNPAGRKFLPPRSLLTWSALFTLVQLREVSKGPQCHSAGWPPPLSVFTKGPGREPAAAPPGTGTQTHPRPPEGRQISDLTPNARRDAGAPQRGGRQGQGHSEGTGQADSWTQREEGTDVGLGGVGGAGGTAGRPHHTKGTCGTESGGGTKSVVATVKGTRGLFLKG